MGRVACGVGCVWNRENRFYFPKGDETTRNHDPEPWARARNVAYVQEMTRLSTTLVLHQDDHGMEQPDHGMGTKGRASDRMAQG